VYCVLLVQMLGPVIAPFIGAALTHAFGWRSMMWFLAILSGALQLVVLLIYWWVTQELLASCSCRGDQCMSVDGRRTWGGNVL
jgi:MFS family permease